jgi:hypothetical protein
MPAADRIRSPQAGSEQERTLMSLSKLHKVAGAAGLSPGGGRGGRARSWRARWTAGIAAAAAAAVSGAVLLAAPPASAAGTLDSTGTLDSFEMAFQANTGALWEACTAQSGSQCVAGAPLGRDPVDTGLGMAAGTSPSVAPPLEGSGPYQFAFQANTGDLWTDGSSTGGGEDLGLGMMAGTSPAIEAVPSTGGYVIAFQANTGDLVTTVLGASGSVSTTYWDLPMAAGTSPSVAALPAGSSDPDGSYDVAYQNSDGYLSLAGPQGTGSLGLGMKAGTSPSIAELADGYQIAFQANTGDLWTTGTAGTADLGLGMDNSTSPSIAMAVTSGAPINEADNNYEIAFQANTGDLWATGNAGLPGGDLGQAMQPGTSPAISGETGITTVVGSTPSTTFAGYAVAYQSSAGFLSYYDSPSGNIFDTGLGMDNSTSPAIGPPPNAPE